MIDTHCHLSIDDDNLEAVIKKMEKNIMVVSGADLKSSKEAYQLSKQYPNIYATVGFHPDEAGKVSEEDLEVLKGFLTDSKVVGIGEIGLDYYHGKDNQKEQQELFLKQIALAQQYDLPIVVHSRDAMEDTYAILSQYPNMKIVLHCFSGSVEMARKFVSFGCRLGIGGVVTFKNGRRLQEVVKEIPLEYLLLETDSPYLTPEPFRGEVNEPYNILLVAQKIAEIKEIPLETVLNVTTVNSISQFDLPSDLC